VGDANGNGSTTGVRVYVDPAVAGLRVKADGGSEATDATHGGRVAHASREMFEGRLTGRRLDQGDPPWRWLEISDLTEKPAGFEEASVWCEESYIYYVDGKA
jgi:hypothetical protein